MNEATTMARMIERTERSKRIAPFRIAGIYILLGFAWIVSSDSVLAFFVKNPTTLTSLQTLKGWFYVSATAVLLYFLIRRDMDAIRRSEEGLRATIESMPDAVLIIEPDGNVVQANRAAVDLTGLSDRAQLLCPLAALLRLLNLRDSNGRPIVWDEEHAARRALHGETIRGLERIIVRPDRQDVFVNVNVAPVRIRGDNKVAMAVAVIRDVTEIKRLERLRDEFLSTAAHELKTPVATVKAYVQLLRLWAPEGHEPREGRAFMVLNRQCDRIQQLVEELLEVSRLQLGRLDLQCRPVELGALVADVLERMESVAMRHQLRLQREAEALVHADPDRIDQVLVNLVDNAIKFSPTGGEVRARLYLNGTEAVIAVADHGVGIPADRQEHVFERFYRAHAGTCDDYGGMGVGLHISREIVAKHGGRIWFESTQGHGSTFSFSLPLSLRSEHATAV